MILSKASAWWCALSVGALWVLAAVVLLTSSAQPHRSAGAPEGWIGAVSALPPRAVPLPERSSAAVGGSRGATSARADAERARADAPSGAAVARSRSRAVTEAVVSVRVSDKTYLPPVDEWRQE